MKSNLTIPPYIEALLSKFKKKGHREFIYPSREWATGLLLATVVFVGGVCLIALDFYNQFGTTADPIVTSEEPIMYREREVTSFAEQYKAREKIFMELRRNRQFVPPPVIEETASSTRDAEEGELLAEDES